MTMKLVQKSLLRGTREFEIAGELIHVRINSVFRKEKLSVVLTMLNPEPVVNGDCLEFRSRVNSDTLLSLYRDSPDAQSFERFVALLGQRAREEYGAFTGIRTHSGENGPAANSYAEPPEFGDPKKPAAGAAGKPVRVESLDSSLHMLRQHLDSDDILPLLEALEALRANPNDESSFDRLVGAFEALGPQQGAVLTYAPYIGILLSDDPFGF